MSNYKSSLNLTAGDTFVLGGVTHTVTGNIKIAEAMAYTTKMRVEVPTANGPVRVIAGIPVKIVS